MAANGINAESVGRKYGFESFATSSGEMLKDKETDLVIVLTRHGSHARMVREAFLLGKHVFVEKPLALNRLQLSEVLDAYSESKISTLAVGYNRRFAPTSVWLREKFASISEPIGLSFRVNAGAISRDSWVYDKEEGGGRIVGEICHFIDLVQFLSNSLVAEVFCESLGSDRYHPTDNLAIALKTENGSIATIAYFAGGDKSYPRERVEIVGGGAMGVLENFRTATFTSSGRTEKFGRGRGLNRGHREILKNYLLSIRIGADQPVSMEEYVNTSLSTFCLEQSLKNNKPVFVERI